MDLQEISDRTAPTVDQADKREKAAELNYPYYLITDKLSVSSKRKKVKLLTLAPDSWSRKRVADFLLNTKYMLPVN